MVEPLSIDKPWGGFRQFVKNAPATVKILFVKQGEEFSLQKHAHRSEFWRVLKGSPEITIGDQVVKAKSGDEFSIAIDTIHRVSAPSDDVEILEVAEGQFDEDDIVRLQDKYGRS